MPRPRLARALHYGAVASLMAGLGCGELPAPATCVGEPQLIELTGAQLCGITRSGWVLLAELDTQDLVLSHLSDAGTLDERARLPGIGSGCGLIAHEPGDPAIWVAQTSPFGLPELPDRLHRITLDGALTWTGALEHEGSLIRANALTTHAGQLFVGGRLQTHGPDGDIIDSTLVVQSRDQDQVAWTQTGYQGLSPDPGAAMWPQDSLGQLAWTQAGLSFTAYKSWIDSSTISLFTVAETDGAPLGAALLTSDDFSALGFELSDDRDQQLFVSAGRRSIDDGNTLAPAKSLVTAYAPGPTIAWTSEIEWPTLSAPHASRTAQIGDHLFSVASGRDDAWTQHVHIARLDRDGNVECSEELEPLEGWSGTTLTGLEDGRLVMRARREPDELDNEPPKERLIIMQQDH